MKAHLQYPEAYAIHMFKPIFITRPIYVISAVEVTIKSLDL